MASGRGDISDSRNLFLHDFEELPVEQDSNTAEGLESNQTIDDAGDHTDQKISPQNTTAEQSLEDIIPRTITNFQRDILRAFLNERIKSDKKNVMFVAIKQDGQLVFYHYYVSTEDKGRHSEYYISKNFDSVIPQIQKSLQRLDAESDKLEVVIFSKNSSCNQCEKDGFIYQFCENIHKESLEKLMIQNVNIQHIWIYQKIERNGTSKTFHTQALPNYTDRNVTCMSLNWPEFLAVFVQWCQTHQKCMELVCKLTLNDNEKCTECQNKQEKEIRKYREKARPVACTHVHSHDIHNNIYQKIMQRKLSVDEATKEIKRLAKADTQEQIDVHKHIEEQTMQRIERFLESPDDISETSSQVSSTSSVSGSSQSSYASAQSKVSTYVHNLIYENKLLKSEKETKDIKLGELEAKLKDLEFEKNILQETQQTLQNTNEVLHAENEGLKDFNNDLLQRDRKREQDIEDLRKLFSQQLAQQIDKNLQLEEEIKRLQKNKPSES